MKFCHPDALNQHDRTGLVRDHKQCSDIRCSDQILFPSLRSIYTCFFFFFFGSNIGPNKRLRVYPSHAKPSRSFDLWQEKPDRWL